MVLRGLTAGSLVGALAGALLLCGGCGTMGQKLNGWPGLQAGEEVAVLPFKDHVSSDPEDRDGTGLICQSLIANAIRQEHQAVQVQAPVPEDYDPASGYTRDRAATLGQEAGADYVVFGQCIEFYRVAPMTFRPDRGGVSVSILSLPGGELVYSMQRIHQVSNIQTPEDAIEELVEEMAEELHIED